MRRKSVPILLLGRASQGPEALVQAAHDVPNCLQWAGKGT